MDPECSLISKQLWGAVREEVNPPRRGLDSPYWFKATEEHTGVFPYNKVARVTRCVSLHSPREVGAIIFPISQVGSLRLRRVEHIVIC